MKQFHNILLFTVLILFACKKEESAPAESQTAPNIILVIADDMGLDACPGYEVGSIKPNMPTLQSLIESGIRFNNLWSNPTCSPTRASILTGKYGFRTGVSRVGDELSTTEKSVFTLLDEKTNNTYSHAVIGKWHLSTDANHPNNMGVGHYAGLISGAVQSYWNWDLTTNGHTATSTQYTTTQFTDLAIDWVSTQTQPWFLWLSYNAPHTPFHLPPNDLHYQGALPSDDASIEANPIPYYMAMLESVDTEMGRLLNTLSDEERANTVVIFIGDNGSPNQVAQEYNSQRVKGSLYQGGVNVPLIVAGKGVTRMNQTEDALISTTDLFSTIADLAGTGIAKMHDSESFKSLLSSGNMESREYVYSEIGHADGLSSYTIRNSTHKYIYFQEGSEALYNLSLNPFEKPNLLHENQLPLSATDEAMKMELLEALKGIRE